MAHHKIFIDGQVGTTGLQIVERLNSRSDISLMEIPHEHRKEYKIKKDFLNSADMVVLCLPDEAAKDSVGMVDDDRVKILDASTAHRTNDDWTYGLPELEPKQREKIRSAKRVSIPGCYPSGFLIGIAPLVRSGILAPDYPVTVNAVSGYSGGGRQLIEKYKNQEKKPLEQLWSYRPYGLNLAHKHVPEMWKYSGLQHAPLFVPAVGHFERGMLVSIPLLTRLLKKNVVVENIHSQLSEYYADECFVNVCPLNDLDSLNNGFLSPIDCNGTNRIDLMVFGSQTQILVVARLDNLGKGASGAAVQNLNIMLGEEETKGVGSS